MSVPGGFRTTGLCFHANPRSVEIGATRRVARAPDSAQRHLLPGKPECSFLASVPISHFCY